MSEVAFQVNKVIQRLGGLAALPDVSTGVPGGGIVGIISPNGTRRTTLFNVIIEMHCPTGGKALILGKDVIGQEPHEITRTGFSRTPQDTRLFLKMTAPDNVSVDTHINTRAGPSSAIFNAKAKREEERQIGEQTGELPRLLGLCEVWYEVSTSLSCGDQRKLEIAGVLAVQPKFLLLDEPAAGMNG